MFVTPTKLEKYCYPMKSSYLGNFLFLPWKFYFPPLETFCYSLGTEKLLRWNSKVPPLELKSSNSGTIFGTRMYNGFSTIQEELYLVDEVQL